MNANDLRYGILVGVDSLFAGTAPGYNDKQISSIINRAQRRVFRDKAKIFDTDEKVKRMLAPLLKRGSYVDMGNASQRIATTTDVTIIDYPHTTSLLTGTFYTLPVEVGFLVEEIVKLSIGGVITQADIVLPITYDYFSKNHKNRYKKPSTNLVWRMDAKLELETVAQVLRPCVELIYPNTHTISDYIISYLKYPVDITVCIGTPANQVSCEITDTSFQDEIIGESIKIITASLNDASYEVVATEKKFDEN
jgi:hypothetical protein